MKRILLFFLLLFLFCCVKPSNSSELQGGYSITGILTFYDSLIADIEYYDAEGIDTRNRTKLVKWKVYKKYYRSRLEMCKDKKCVEEIFSRFGEGFVNLHSEFSLASDIKGSQATDSVCKSSHPIAFEYPSLNFFDFTTSQKISRLNSKPIEEVLEHFINYECPYSSSSGCIRFFTGKLNRNRILIEGKPLQRIEYTDGKSVNVNFVRQKRRAAEDAKQKFSASRPDWQQVSEGDKFVLLKKNKTFLLKFVDFNYSNSDSDLYCGQDAPTNTLCYDVQRLVEALRIHQPIEHLVIDLQNNGGGVEITPLLVVLAKRPFHDLAIRMKKTKALENDSIRPYLFWFSPRLEDWYSKLRQEQSYKLTSYGDLLSPSADFCRGYYDCQFQPVALSPNHLAINTVILVTNNNCVSSCDDFVWRMHEYSDAIVTGQTQAADATFSRISLTYYNHHGTLVKKVHGIEQVPDKKDVFFSMTLPNSATVTEDGRPRQGIPAKLDFAVPIVKEHNADIEIHTLTEVLKKYSLNE